MKPFEQLKLLYEQIFNLNNEILEHIEKGLTNEAAIKTSQFERISTQINLAKKGLNLSEDEKKEIDEIDKKALETITSTINQMVELKIEIQKELKKTNHTMKVNSAYTAQAPISGQILDEEE